MFGVKQTLGYHIKLVRENRFSCRVCCEKFGLKRFLPTHVNSGHDGGFYFSSLMNCLNMTDEITLRTKLMSTVSTGESFLTFTVHHGEKPLSCGEYGHMFGVKETLGYHIKTIHEKRFSCS